ncbi:uncharacterized protein LOC111412985 isoform X2 [Olea europaea var. sylvestris]|uniref:uncharacterized protein LOC111412985 isoform X2 n=1 Tax=Olea europaea var. sylvestris TaxID=158386 RepID=UPI000C1D2A16|nr:uncharacterized protein LOC111412985 isoform X2 [Olea europaea var. sylvestris]
MAVGLSEIGVKMRKVMICTIRGCFRSVCSHPFLVGFLCFLIFLHRSFPFAFSLLVSASPILVCTAVLLGTLLSFGQPNIPEIEREEKTTHGIVSLKTGVSGNSTVVERNESYSVERYDDIRRDAVEKLTKQLSSEAGKTSDVDGDDSLDDTAPLIGERSRKTERENKIIEEAQRESGDLRHEQERELKEEKLGNEKLLENQYSSIPNDEPLESDDDKSQADSFDSERVNVDSLDSPPRSPWTRIQEVNEEEKEENEALDSESDMTESSSPDASMTEIIPMLDELHPLLDEAAPQPVHLSHDGSDAALERSPKSSTGSHESDDETENHDLEVADDDKEEAEDDDEEDTQGDREEQTKSAITWTEEDQKNLMDLGSSELERNQRLENLIARRRAKKNMSVLPEKNLIDLESVDLPFNIAPISTRRHNPFDLPHDNSGLPPIPGSAPSILLPRRNPFDIPYDSSEEKPNLVGDDFREEFMMFQPKELAFRRHESFNVGPSIFAPNRQENRDIKLRPYFVPEGMVLEATSFSPFQRQSSELSDSKVSSVPETESTGSVGDLEDGKLAEEDLSEEAEVISKTKDVIEEVISQETELISENEDSVEEDIPQEPELISKIEDVSEFVGHGSQSSEEVESLELDQVEKRDADVDELDIQLGDVENHYEEGNVAGSEEVQATEFHSSVEASEQRYNSSSSSSSLSEVSERIFNEKEGDILLTLEERRDAFPEGQDISTQPSLESADLNIASTSVGDNPYKDPVYDSSPQACRKNLSLSSTSSDVHVESELGMLPELVKRSVSFIERESEGSCQKMEDSSNNVEMLTEFPKLHPVNKNEVGTKNLVDIRKHDIMDSDFSGVDQIHVESSARASMEENISYQHTSYQHAQGGVSSFDGDSHVMVHPVAEQTFKSSTDKILGQSEEQKHSLISEQASVTQLNTPPFMLQLSDEGSFDKEEAVRSAQDQVPSSDSDVKFDAGFHNEAEEKLISSHYSKEKSNSHPDDELDFTDKPTIEQEAPHTLVQSIEEAITKDSSSIPDVKELYSEISSNFISPQLEAHEMKTAASLSISNTSTIGEVGNGDTIPALDNCNFPAEAISSCVDEQIMVEDTGEIEEIDGLLSELDAVGDFNVNQYQTSFNKFEGPVDSSEESLTSPHEATGTIEHIDSSNREFVARDVENLIHPKSSEEESLPPKESEDNLNSEENNSSMPVVEVQSIEDVEYMFKKSTLMETEVMVAEPEMSHQDEVDVDVNSRMTDLKAQTLQDIDLAFKQMCERENEKPVVVQLPDTELIVEETKVECSADGILTNTKIELPTLDVTSTEDFTLVRTKVHDGIVQQSTLPDSLGDAPHVMDSRNMQGTTSELQAVETMPSEDVDLEKRLKPNSEDGVKEMDAVAAEEPDPELETPKNTSSTTSGTQKEKQYQKSRSSSSSSSSSDSSSSDSDRE